MTNALMMSSSARGEMLVELPSFEPGWRTAMLADDDSPPTWPMSHGSVSLQRRSGAEGEAADVWSLRQTATTLWPPIFSTTTGGASPTAS
jgi:hypothetical protein